MTVKTMVLDTSVIMHDWLAPFKFEEHEVVIPLVVIEELEKNKMRNDEKGKNARRFIDELDRLEDEQNVVEKGYVDLADGGKLIIEINNIKSALVDSVLKERSNDNRILSVAVNLKEKNRNVLVVTNDKAMRVKGRRLGLNVQSYLNDRMVKRSEDVYSGEIEIHTTNEIVSRIYDEGGEISLKELDDLLEGNLLNDDVYTNTFLTVKGMNTSILLRVVKKNGEKYAQTYKQLGENEAIYEKIKPRNKEQKMAAEVLLDDQLDLVIIMGSAGTGKTLLALATALQKQQELNRSVMVTRAEVVVGNERGFLPGDDLEKTLPWMKGIMDNLEVLYDAQGNRKKMAGILDGMNGVIDFESMAYIRGRSIPNRTVIIEEAQNTTPTEIQTLLSRGAEGSRYVLLGDPNQIDVPYLDSVNNGLVYAAEKMKVSDYSAVLKMTKVERSRLAEEVTRLFSKK